MKNKAILYIDLYGLTLACFGPLGIIVVYPHSFPGPTMELSDTGDERPVEPTAAEEKWIQHAKKKLARGYVLIVNTTRRNANFFMAGKGYEMCSYPAALHLIKHNEVIETGTHYLGVVYSLPSDAS